MRRSVSRLCIGLSVLLSGCATLPVDADRRMALAVALDASRDQNDALAARAAERFFDGGTEDEPDWDRVVLLQARALERLGLVFAATTAYVEIARERRDPEQIPDAMRALERVVLHHAWDEDTLLAGFVGPADLPRLPEDVQSFVDYHKGLDALRRGDEAWARKRFEAVPATSRWADRAAYVLAVRAVAAGDLESAAAGFGAMLEDPDLDADVAADARRSLARLRLHAGDWAAATRHYEVLREAAPRDPELLLELAWTAFYQAKPRRALGLLLALDAPVHRRLIAPERFLLEAMALQRLCQFDPARRAASRLRGRYRAAFAELYAGVPPERATALRATARRRGAAAGVSALVDQLEAEQRRLVEVRGLLGEDLAARLSAWYARGLREARAHERVVVTREARRLADDLLRAEEGVRLVLHELGVAVLRGHQRRGGPVDENVAAAPAPGEFTTYDFVGEYWTDELDDLVVRVEDRCIEP